MSMRLRQLATAFLLLLAATTVWSLGEDTHAIATAMKKQFDRPDAPLQVAPVTVEGDYAVAGWLQAGKGGRALLQKSQGAWTIAVCAGDGLKDPKVLESTGMSSATARKLARAVVAAESKLGVDVRTRFASFEGIVKVDAAAPHAHGAHHAAPTGHHMPAKATGH